MHAALLSLALAAAPAADCPALFGDPATRPAADARLDRLLVRLDVEDGVLHLVHRGPFHEARPARLDGLVLAAVEDGAAVVELADEGGACAPGAYRLVPGDKLGGGRILAAAGGAVLLARGDELLVLAPDGARAPRVRLTWASPWKLYPRRAAATSAPAPAKPSRAKPKGKSRR